jgi:hypothetical protein
MEQWSRIVWTDSRMESRIQKRMEQNLGVEVIRRMGKNRWGSIKQCGVEKAVEWRVVKAVE